MNLVLSIFLIALQISNVHTINIATGNGDVYIQTEKDKKSLKIPDRFIQFNYDTLIILNSWNRPIYLNIPEDISVLIKSVNGEINVYGERLKFIDISTFTGDVRVHISTADSIKIFSHTGDIYISYKDTVGKMKIQSKTGDIVYKGYIFPDLTIHSLSGDIDIYTLKIGKKTDLSRISSTFGEVEIYDESTGNFKIVKSHKQLEGNIGKYIENKRINILKENGHEKDVSCSFKPFSSWQRPVIEFTKADGMVLNLPFGDKKYHDFYGGYIGYAFTAKRFDFYLHGFKTIYRPMFLYFRLYSERRSPDAWKLSSWENTLSSVLLHEDFADFYRATGMGIFAGFITRSFWIGIGIEKQKLESLSNQTNWSLFFKESRAFNPNRHIIEGEPEFIKLEGFFNPARELRVKAEIENQISTSYLRFNRIFISANINLVSSSGMKLLSKVRAGYSSDTLSNPFDFYIGGPFTLPGFAWKAFYGDVWMSLINTFLLIDISDNTFFLRLDAGKTNRMDNPELDIGIGLLLDGIYFGVAFPISESQGNPNVFAGLRRNL